VIDALTGQGINIRHACAVLGVVSVKAGELHRSALARIEEEDQDDPIPGGRSAADNSE
jgi:hypothetical protein